MSNEGNLNQGVVPPPPVAAPPQAVAPPRADASPMADAPPMVLMSSRFPAFARPLGNGGPLSRFHSQLGTPRTLFENDYAGALPTPGPAPAPARTAVSDQDVSAGGPSAPHLQMGLPGQMTEVMARLSALSGFAGEIQICKEALQTLNQENLALRQENQALRQEVNEVKAH